MNNSEQSNTPAGAGTATPPPVKASKRVPKWQRAPLPGIPLLRGHMLPGQWPRTVAVWCIPCQTCHTHGFDPDEGPLNRIEHRCAHCDDFGRRSPFRDSGYFIGITKWEQARIRQERLAARKLAHKSKEGGNP